MTNRDLPSLITPNPTAGLELADDLAERLRGHFQPAADQLDRPGGTNYRQVPAVPVETIASILFYAIAAANHGWSSHH